MRGYSSFEKQHVTARNNQQTILWKFTWINTLRKPAEKLEGINNRTAWKFGSFEKHQNKKFWKIPKQEVLENMRNEKVESWKFTYGNSIESLHWKTYNVWRNNEEYYVWKMWCFGKLAWKYWQRGRLALWKLAPGNSAFWKTREGKFHTGNFYVVEKLTSGNFAAWITCVFWKNNIRNGTPEMWRFYGGFMEILWWLYE